MSVFWIIRLALIAVLGAMVVVGSYLLRNRKQYQRLLNSWFFNVLLVLIYQLFSYLIVILPSAESNINVRNFLMFLLEVCLFVQGFYCRLSQPCREKLLVPRISEKNS